MNATRRGGLGATAASAMGIDSKNGNAAGTLPDGTFFDGPVDLKKVLLERKRDFVWCLSEKLLTYALGRGIEYFDDCALEDIVKAVEADDYRFSRLVIEVVRSVPFRMKRSQESSP